MPVTKVGLVYYADDPSQVVFKRVYPTADDSELENQCWVTDCCDPSRAVAMKIVDAGSSEATAAWLGETPPPLPPSDTTMYPGPNPGAVT